MSLTSPDLGRVWREQRFDPNRALTPQRLAAALSSFEAGYLRDAALIWEGVEDKDDTAKIAVPKRRKSVSRRPWRIIKLDDSPEANRDEEALKFFYNNLTCTVATDLNVRGGVRKLINLMMTAEFYQYAAFEIIWQPRKVGGRQLLTAELRFVPLYFFENKTGALRYCGANFYTDGKPLEEDGWLVHTGDGLHKALGICSLFKKFALQDWINFSEKFGIPGVHGETSAAQGSPEWNAFNDGLARFASEMVITTSPGAKINLIEASKTGDQPFRPMVEMMSRSITALCRGADLGTMSSQDGTGASLQEGETNLLLEDDCENVTETLNTKLDRFVLKWVNGPARESKAYIKVVPPAPSATALDIQIDKHLVELGGELEAAETYERYERSMPDSLQGRILRQAGAQPAEPQPPEAAANDATVNASADFFGVAAEWLAPLRDLFAQIEQKAADKTVSDADLLAWLDEAVKTMPELYAAMDVAAFANYLEAVLGDAALTGLREGLRKTTQS